MSEMAPQIIEIWYAPIDLSTLVDPEFIYWEVLVFQLKAIGLRKLVGSNPKSLSADEIIRTLNTKLWSLKSQGLRSPDKSKQLDTEGELAGPKLATNKLV